MGFHKSNLLNFIYSLFLIIIFIFYSIQFSQASDTHSLEDIESKAIHFIKNHLLSSTLLPENSQLSIEIHPINNNVVLPDCQENLDFKIHGINIRSLERLSLKTICNGPQKWSIYIKAKATVTASVLIARYGLPKGAVVSESDLYTKILPVNNLHRGYFQNANQVIGTTTKMAIKSGQIINPTQIKPRLSVNKGDYVTILFSQSGLSVAMNGTALAGGQIGEQIKVKNSSSNRVIAARIKGQGVVVTSR